MAKYDVKTQTVIVVNRTGEVIHRYEEKIPLRVALEQYAEEQGLADTNIRKTPFGYRMSSDQGDFRATYRRT